MFFAKLAQQNIRKNKQAFVPFILSMIFLAALNTLMLLVANDPGLAKLRGAEAITQLFGFGSVVILIFSVIFATYTGNILNKQRKKEFGLYNVLGLGKRELYKLNFFENLFSLVVTLVAGLLTGVIFSRLAYLIIKKLLGVGNEFSFSIQPTILLSVVIIIVGLYFWLYLISVISIFKSDPIELLHAKQKGEKEPKANWLLAIVGVVALVWGYWIALTIQSPVSAIMNFFTAVLLVVVGTYLLFMAGSIVILKLLRKNEKYYYNVKHFIPVSGMIYRMKQNAVGLASICVLSTMVLVTVATTAGLFFGSNDQVNQNFPREIMISSGSPLNEVKKAATDYAAKENVKLTDLQEVKSTQPLLFTTENNGLKVSNRIEFTTKKIGKAVDVILMSLADYQQATGSKLALKSKNDILLYTTDSKYQGQILNLSGTKFNVTEQLNEDAVSALGNLSTTPVPLYLVIVKDQSQIDSLLNKWYSTKEMVSYKDLAYQFNFNFSLKNEAKRKAFIRGLSKALAASGQSGYVFETKDSYRESIKLFDGGFFFIGIILGTAFLLATALIIYYKQVSEGMDDREQFVILQKVGMDDQEVKRVIHSQIMMVFAFPLIVALIHVAFAFPLIKKMLILFGITNWQLFLLVTIVVALIFSILYYIVYQLTARVYYRLVER